MFLKGFGQVYVTTAYPHVVKAWHMHKNQTDHVTRLKGTIKLVLYDNRENSKSREELNEFVIGERNPILVKILLTVWHDFRTVGEETAFVVNIPPSYTAMKSQKRIGCLQTLRRSLMTGNWHPG